MYLPGRQAEQYPSFEPWQLERAPAGQAAHNIHWATLEFVEYLPVSQSTQFVAPGSIPALVIEPAWHSLQ